MLTIVQKIQQVESAIKLMTMQLSAGRARPEQLDPLREELTRLQRQARSAPAQEVPATRPIAPVGKMASRPLGDAYADRQATLTLEADGLRKEQTKLSNMLHKVPPHQDCYELTGRIVDLQTQIEDLWDEKKFIERNGMDATGGFREAAPQAAPVARPLDDVQHKAVLTVDLQRLREKRSKLARKLENPKASDSKKAEWSTELAKASSQIEELTAERYVL